MISVATKKKKIYFINDRTELNSRYRSSLMAEFQRYGYEVVSLSLFGVFLVRLRKKNSDIIYSSNIRSNILTLILFYRNVFIILNGLGRLGNLYLFRLMIGCLLSVGDREIFIQNYRDYRYFRKYFKIRNTYWVPGSGATQKVIALEKGFFNVNRNNKILLCKRELHDFIENYKSDVKIVGVDQSVPLPDKVHSIGWVDSKHILAYGDKFVWLGGYGDGFPHSLADALFNKVETYISRREFINLGIYKMKKNYQRENVWYIIPPQDFSELSNKEVNFAYMRPNLRKL